MRSTHYARATSRAVAATITAFALLNAWACGESKKQNTQVVPDAGGSDCSDSDEDGFCEDGTGDGKKVDCDDFSSFRNPALKELCNGVDDNCDGSIDEGGAACALTCEEPVGGCEKPVELAAGERHVCALTDAGNVYCWGSNERGQLGIGEIAYSPRPVRVPGVRGASNLVAGALGNCVETDDGVVCWGMDWAQAVVMPVPKSVRARVLTSLDVCWLDNANVVSCFPAWPGAEGEVETVVADVRSVVATASGPCVVRNDQSAECYSLHTSATKPKQIAAGGVERLFAGRDDRVCALSASGLKCGETSVPGNESAVFALTSPTRACALGATGRVACWEGDAPTVEDATRLVLGLDFACVLRKDATIGCWGSRTDGALGDGELSSRATTDSLVSPFGGPAYPNVADKVLGSGTSGACDSYADLEAIASGVHLLRQVLNCQEMCGDMLDPVSCRSQCIKSSASAGCLSCFTEFAACTAPKDCRAALVSCVGFSPEFIEANGSPPDFECSAGACRTDLKPHGAACKEGSECLSHECGAPPYSPDAESICLARDGSDCLSGSVHCECDEGQDYCGYCSGPGRVASGKSSFSDYGNCHRDCTEDDAICPFNSMCRFFSDGDGKYCN